MQNKSIAIRVKILEYCKNQHSSIKEIADHLGVKRTTINHHLLELLSGEWILKIKNYRLNGKSWEDAYKTIDDTNYTNREIVPEYVSKIDISNWDFDLKFRMGFTDIVPNIF